MELPLEDPWEFDEVVSWNFMEFEINGEISTESNGNDVLNHHEEVF